MTSSLIPNWIKESKLADENFSQWLSASRQKHWDAFLSCGLPTRKNERWKYTDLASLMEQHFAPAHRIDADMLWDAISQHRLRREESIMMVLVNGYFMPPLSDLHKLPREVIALNIRDAHKTYIEKIRDQLKPIDTQKYPFASLNIALFNDGLFFQVPDNCKLSAPIHLLSIVTDENTFAAHPHHLLVLGKNSQMTVVEEHFSLVNQTYLMNVMTHILIDQEAKLEHVKIQNEGRNAIHIANTFVQQKNNSSIIYTNFSTGSQFARDDMEIVLQEPGANCHTAGFYHLQQDNQYIDHHIDICHAAPHSMSGMLYKGILDKKSCAVFNGRLHVEKNAQKTLAYQANHNLLLSKNAEVYSKPELEIYADDVKCKHGATTGQLDQDALFYMQARGIEKQEAISILLQGFIEEIMQRITHLGIKIRVQELVMP